MHKLTLSLLVPSAILGILILLFSAGLPSIAATPEEELQTCDTPWTAIQSPLQSRLNVGDEFEVRAVLVNPPDSTHPLLGPPSLDLRFDSDTPVLEVTHTISPANGGDIPAGAVSSSTTFRVKAVGVGTARLSAQAYTEVLPPPVCNPSAPDCNPTYIIVSGPAQEIRVISPDVPPDVVPQVYLPILHHTYPISVPVLGHWIGTNAKGLNAGEFDIITGERGPLLTNLDLHDSYYGGVTCVITDSIPLRLVEVSPQEYRYRLDYQDIRNTPHVCPVFFHNPDVAFNIDFHSARYAVGVVSKYGGPMLPGGSHSTYFQPESP